MFRLQLKLLIPTAVLDEPSGEVEPAGLAREVLQVTAAFFTPPARERGWLAASCCPPQNTPC